jgi:hypothetical protein
MLGLRDRAALLLIYIIVLVHTIENRASIKDVANIFRTIDAEACIVRCVAAVSVGQLSEKEGIIRNSCSRVPVIVSSVDNGGTGSNNSQRYRLQDHAAHNQLSPWSVGTDSFRWEFQPPVFSSSESAPLNIELFRHPAFIFTVHYVFSIFESKTQGPLNISRWSMSRVLKFRNSFIRGAEIWNKSCFGTELNSKSSERDPRPLILSKLVDGGLQGVMRPFIACNGVGFRVDSCLSAARSTLIESVPRHLDSVLRGSGGLAHLNKLTVVNLGDHDVEDQPNNANTNQPPLPGSDVPLKLFCCTLALIGLVVSGGGWYVLISQRFPWGLHRRLLLWGTANAVAAILYWHVTSFLLGI